MTISTKLKPLAVSYAIVAAVGCGSKGTISPKVPSQQHAVKKINTGLGSPGDEEDPTTTVAKTDERLSASTAPTGVPPKPQDATSYPQLTYKAPPCPTTYRLRRDPSTDPKADYFIKYDFKIKPLVAFWRPLFLWDTRLVRDTLGQIGSHYTPKIVSYLKFWRHLSPPFSLRRNRLSPIKTLRYIVGTDYDGQVQFDKENKFRISGIKQDKISLVDQRIAHMLLVILDAMLRHSPENEHLIKLKEGEKKAVFHIERAIESEGMVKVIVEALNEEIKKPRGDDPEDKATSLIGTPYDGGKVQEIPGINRKLERKGEPYKIEDFIGKLTKEEEKKYSQVIGKASFVRYTRSSTQGP